MTYRSLIIRRVFITINRLSVITYYGCIMRNVLFIFFLVNVRFVLNDRVSEFGRESSRVVCASSDTLQPPGKTLLFYNGFQNVFSPPPIALDEL